jgi:DNA polymerase-3 subunit gamma/tau
VSLKIATPAGRQADSSDGLSSVLPAAESLPVQSAAQAVEQDWPAVIEAMQLRGMVKELAMNCSIKRCDDQCWELVLDPGHQQLLSADREARLQKSLCHWLKKNVSLEIKVETGAGRTPAVQRQEREAARQADAVAAIEADPNVQALQDIFDATVHRETIRPRDGH